MEEAKVRKQLESRAVAAGKRKKEAAEKKQLESRAVAAGKKKKEAAETKQLESGADAPGKKKKRSIVEWTPEEDDILREQIEILGAEESWTTIASKFKGKTSRQCRRRWLFCLNTDLKKGNWSPEEDKLLCKAQKKYGNRWTEIAKVVKGRTDNAVKNRFKSLCAKQQASGKEISTLDIDENSKRPVSNDVGSQYKKRRLAKRSGPLTKCNNGIASDKDPVNGRKQQLRPSLAELSQNIQKSDRKTEGPSKSLATELISLRMEENMDFTSNDFQDLRGFLHKDKHSGEESSSFEENFDGHLLDDLLTDSGNELSNTTDVQSETIDTNGVNTKAPAIETTDQEEEILVNVIETPLFKALAATIPSPRFSAGERNYLMKTLGIESPSIEKTTNHSEEPSCRKELFHAFDHS